MKKLIFAAVGLLVFGLPAIGAAQEIRVQAHWTGVYFGEFCDGAPCGGDLVTCAAGEVFGPSQGVFEVLDGICNDFDDPDVVTDCGGRFTWYNEECFLIPGGEVDAGSLNIFYGPGKQRYCFNDPATGAGACAGTPPIESIILEANVLEQGRIDTNNTDAGYTGESFVTDVTTTAFFDPEDGKVKMLQAVPAIMHWTAEEDFTDPFCELGVSPGCGWAGSTVIVGQPRPTRFQR